MDRATKPIEFGWFARGAIRNLAPEPIAESFAGDLLEEANQRILPLRGERGTRRWIGIQIARAAPRLLVMPLLERGHFGAARLTTMALSAGTTWLVIGTTGCLPFFEPFIASSATGPIGARHRAVWLLVAHVFFLIEITFGYRSRLARAIGLFAMLLAPIGGAPLFFSMPEASPIPWLAGLPTLLSAALRLIERRSARNTNDCTPT